MQGVTAMVESDSASASPAEPRMPRVVCVLVLGMVLGLIGLEMALAVVGGPDEQGDALHVHDERTLWRNASNFRDEWLSTDSYGMRNPGLPRDADKRELRILTLGDSRVFGARDFGPKDEETWQAYLQAQLGPRAKEGVRVLNGGVGGFSTVQACQHGLRLIEVVEPDLVMLLITPGGRCLVDASSTYANELVDGQLVPRDIVRSVPRACLKDAATAHVWLSKHSGLYAHYRRVVGELDGGIGEFRGGFVYTGDAELRNDASYFVDRAFRAIEELNRAVAHKRSRFVAVVLHDHPGTNDVAWARFVDAHVNGRGPKAGTSRQQPIEALRARLQRIGVTSWSMLGLQERISGDRLKYFADDGTDWEHFSPIGNQLFAIELAQQFEKSGLLPAMSKARAKAPRR